MTKNIVIDWQSQIVNEWFNSQDSGGFIKCVTDKGFYNNLEDIEIITIYPDPAFNKYPLEKQIAAWFKKRIKTIRSKVAPGDTRMFVVRGCTAQQTFGMTERLKKYVRAKLPDEDSLMRLANRFTSRFINVSGYFLIPEKFFSELLDRVFEHCEESLKKITFVSNDCLSASDITGIIKNFFPDGTTTVYDENDKSLNVATSRPIELVESPKWFGELFSDCGLVDSELDSSETQIIEYAMNEVTEKIKSRM